jgi:hypothetical protein
MVVLRCRFSELMASDIVDDLVAVDEFRGRDAVRGFFAETLAAFTSGLRRSSGLLPGTIPVPALH